MKFYNSFEYHGLGDCSGILTSQLKRLSYQKSHRKYRYTYLKKIVHFNSSCAWYLLQNFEMLELFTWTVHSWPARQVIRLVLSEVDWYNRDDLLEQRVVQVYFWLERLTMFHDHLYEQTKVQIITNSLAISGSKLYNLQYNAALANKW